MKKSLFVLAAVASVFASCQMIDEASPKATKAVDAYSATIEGTTRTAIAESGSVYKVNWIQGDQIVISDGTNLAYYKADNGGTPTANFYFTRGGIPDGTLTAYYPVSILNGFPGTKIYNKDVVESPMIGTVNGTSISFKNICSIIELDVTTTAAGVSVKNIAISADQPMAGEFTLEGGAAKVATGTGVNIYCNEGVAIGTTATPFYIAVPAGEYTGMKITLTTTDAKTQTIALKAGNKINLELAKVHSIEAKFNNLQAGTVGGTAKLPSGKDFNMALKATFDETATEATIDDNIIRKICFCTESPLTTGTNIAAMDSEKPVYVSVDKGSGVAIVSTPATSISVGEDASFMFAYFGALESIENIKALNTAGCTTMQSMFNMAGCDSSRLNTLDLSSFDVSQVISMESMFNYCKGLENLNVKGWNTSAVESMKYMFQYTSSLGDLDLSNWNNEACADFSYFFANSGVKNITLTNFTTDNATTMLYMFAQAKQLEKLDVSSFNTENVSDFGNMFYQCYSIQSVTGLTNWDTSASARFRSMFNRCDAVLELDCSSFDISASTNCNYMFYKCVSLQKLNVSGFDMTGLKASIVAYSMPKLQNIREINFGENFIPLDAPKVPDGFTMYYADLEEESMGKDSPSGVTVLCTKDVAEYLITTDMHYPHNGWHYTNSAGTIDRSHQPVNIVMKDWKTGSEISVTWPANEYYPL